MKMNLPLNDKEISFGEEDRIISTTNLKGVITSVNDTFARISEFSRKELVGANHNVVRHPDASDVRDCVRLCYVRLAHSTVVMSILSWLQRSRLSCR
jgi:PAS domain S-box-containing protein